MTTPVNFRVKNGLTVANGVAVTQGNVTISDGSLVIGATTINATSISSAADNAYANGVNYADGKAADAYSNAAFYADAKASNAYSNAISFAANASNLTTGTLSVNRLPSTVNVSIALNVADTVSIKTSNVTVTQGNDVGTITGTVISFTDSTTETGNTYYAAVSHDELITSKSYVVANVTYADYGQVSRTGMFAVAGLNTSNTSIYVRGVTVNTSVISIGNSSVYSAINSTAFSGNGASLTSVNAATVGGNSASDLRTYTENLASNATYLTSGTVNSARLPSGNSTAAGAVILVDSVSNTSTTAAASAASVKSAYDAAITANTAAGTLAAAAYSNAISYANTKAGDAYSNAVAYSSNASNLSSGTVAIGRIPTVDAVNNTSVSYVATANSVKTAYDAAIAANTRAASAQTAASDAYTNATAFAANASNLSSGTVAIARIPVLDAVNNTSVSYVATANSVKTAYDTAVTANTNAQTALTAAGAAYTNAIAIAANATNLTSGTVNSARLPAGNSTSAGAVVLVDSVANTSTTAAGSAASVKTAYDAAITANTNAQTAATAAASAYTNAVSYTDTKIGTANTAIAAAYTNAVSYTDGKILTANGAITGNAATAYTNAVSYTDGKILTANGAITGNAATAYTNAVSYTDTKIGTANSAIVANAAAAYTNATSFVTAGGYSVNGIVSFYANVTLNSGNSINVIQIANINSTSSSLIANSTALTIGTTLANSTLNATSFSGTANNALNVGGSSLASIQANITANAGAAYSNAVTYTDTKIGTANSAITGNAATAYTNAVSYVDTKIGTANTAMVANAAAAYTNATIFAANASNANNGTLAEARLPYRMNQDVRTTDTVTFGNITVTGNITVQGTTTTVNTATLSVQDNMIYLNANNTVTNPDLGFAGNYNDGSYHHAGFFRDATDGVWKVFDNYSPEPDASAYIDTANATFRIAAFQANTLYIGNTSVYGTINTTAFTGTANNATYAFGKTEGAINANSALTANNSTNLGGQAAAYYTNATNISAGTLAAARLPSLYLGTTTIQSTSAAQAVTGITTLAAGNTTITGFVNATSSVNSAILSVGSNFVANATHVTLGNGKRLHFLSNSAATGAYFELQSDNNLVLYMANTTAGARPAFNIYANSNAGVQGGAFRFNTDIDMASVGIYANNSLGTSGQVLHSNGTSVYWAADDAGVTSVATANGLSGGPITSTGTIGVTTGSTLTVNSTGIHVNTALQVDQILTSNNGGGTNVKIGDDAWFGDVNQADTVRVMGQQNANNGYIVFGNENNAIKLGRAGAGPLTWNSNFAVTGTTTLSANLIMANNNITNPVLTGYTEAEVANTATTGAWTMDCAAANFFELTLTGSITISPSNVPPSTRMWAGTIVAKQDATGGRTITWPTGIKWPGGSAPPATTTANAIDIWSLMTYDGGSTWIGSLTVKGAA